MSQRAQIRFIFVTILLDAIGIGLLIPVMPDVLRRFVSDPTEVSQYFGYFIGAYALMQLLASPVLGSLSDRFGRRLILLVSLAGAAVDYLMMAFAPTLPILFLGRAISGLTGASMTVANSYMADVSDDTNRSANFGMIGAAWGIGFIAGPLLGGLMSTFGAKGPFLAAASLNVLNFAFGCLVLPESLKPEHRRSITMKQLNPLTSILKVLKPSPISAYIWVFFLLFLAGNVHPVNWTLYTQTKFGWTNWEVGLSLSFVGLAIAIVQGGLTRIIIPKLGERRSFTFGLVIHLVAFALYAVAPRGWMMYPITLFFSLAGVTMPALQSIVSTQVPANAQGELQGSFVALGSLAAVLAPFFYTELFVAFTRPGAPVQFPGAAYLGASFLCLIAFALDAVGRRRRKEVLV